jgi:hypothetical protein
MMLVYFTAICHIILTFGIFPGKLVYFSHFGKLLPKNLATLRVSALWEDAPAAPNKKILVTLKIRPSRQVCRPSAEIADKLVRYLNENFD